MRLTGCRLCRRALELNGSMTLDGWGWRAVASAGILCRVVTPFGTIRRRGLGRPVAACGILWRPIATP